MTKTYSETSKAEAPTEGEAPKPAASPLLTIDEYYAREEKRAELNMLNRKRYCAALLEAGVERVTAEYDGSCDSGMIESFSVTPETISEDHMMTLDVFGFEDWSRPDSRVTRAETLSVHTMATLLFYEILDHSYRGWEINDGAFGEFIWDIATDKIQLVHTERFTDYKTTKKEL